METQEIKNDLDPSNSLLKQALVDFSLPPTYFPEQKMEDSYPGQEFSWSSLFNPGSGKDTFLLCDFIPYESETEHGVEFSSLRG